MKKLLRSVLFTLLIGSTVSGLVLGTAILKNQIENQNFQPQIESVPYTSVIVPKDKESVDNPIIKSEQKKSEKQDRIPVIVLSKRNTIVFNDVVTAKSVADLQVKLLEKSNIMPRGATIYLVLDTPGGSVGAGSLLIDTIKAMPQKVKTLTIFAASMGFQFVQNFDDRLILPSGTLMSHRARISGLSGEIGGELDVRLKMIKRRIKYLDTVASKRMGMSLKAYTDLIADEYWTHGFEAVEEKAADKMVLARCGTSLSGTHDKEIRTFFGPVKVTLSNCPLITGPIEIKFDGLTGNQSEVTKFFNKRYQNPKAFVKEYIIENKFEKILKD